MIMKKIFLKNKELNKKGKKKRRKKKKIYKNNKEIQFL
jgi:hypothetical protein